MNAFVGESFEWYTQLYYLVARVANIQAIKTSVFEYMP